MKSDQSVYQCDRCNYIAREVIGEQPAGRWEEVTFHSFGRSARPANTVVHLCSDCANDVDRLIRTRPDAEA